MNGYGKPGYTREEFQREMDAELDAAHTLDREYQGDDHLSDCRYCAAGEPSEHTYEPPADTVEIPEDVRDNSETVTDYAFMRHLSPGRGVVGPTGRDYELRTTREYLNRMYATYSWSDVNPDGQRCRFDMIVNRKSGMVAHLFHTEYWTRVKCTDCEYHWAISYLQVTDWDGNTHPAAPFCEYHGANVKRINASLPGYRIAESAPLLIGQHD